MNDCKFMGRLTKDIEMRATQSGKDYGRFSIAVDDGKDAQGNKKTEFINLLAWEKTAQMIAQYFHKGDGILVHTSCHTTSYQAKDGSKKYVTEFTVRNVEFPVGRRGGDSNGETNQQSIHSNNQNTSMGNLGQSVPFDEDVPF